MALRLRERKAIDSEGTSIIVYGLAWYFFLNSLSFFHYGLLVYNLAASLVLDKYTTLQTDRQIDSLTNKTTIISVS